MLSHWFTRSSVLAALLIARRSQTAWIIISDRARLGCTPILTSMNILALDVGTSSVKAAVLNTATNVPVGAIARAGYVLDTPSPDAAEVPARRLWETAAAAARAALQQS